MSLFRFSRSNPSDESTPATPGSDASHIVLRHERVDAPAAREFLRTRAVGTLSFTLRNRVMVEPVSCALDPDFDEWLYLRPLPGSVLTAELAGSRVAVSVRAEHSPTDWIMATVYGKLYALTTRGEDAAPKAHARAIDLLQAGAPDLATAANEEREEETLYRVAVETLAGRSARAEQV